MAILVDQNGNPLAKNDNYGQDKTKVTKEMRDKIKSNIAESRASRMEKSEITPAYTTEKRIKEAMVGGPKRGSSKSAEASASVFNDNMMSVEDMNALKKDILERRKQEGKPIFKNVQEYKNANKPGSRLTAELKATDAIANLPQTVVEEPKKPRYSENAVKRYQAGERANMDAVDRFGNSRADYNPEAVPKTKPMRNSQIANEIGTVGASGEHTLGNMADELDLRSDWKKGFDSKLDNIKSKVSNVKKQAGDTIKKPFEAAGTNITAMKNKIGKGIYEFNNPFSDVPYEKIQESNKLLKKAEQEATEKAAREGMKEGAEKVVKNNADDVAKAITKTKVGRIAAAVGVGALVVSNMNKNKGQQPNGQLYGQQTPYGY